jgi:hypothetical protein
MWRSEGIDTRDLDRIMAFCSGLVGGARETCFLQMTGSPRGLLQKYSVRLIGSQAHSAGTCGIQLVQAVRPWEQ